MEKMMAHGSVQVASTVARVWDALTQPRFTRQYMFGCEIVCDWQVGSPLLWRGVFNGQEVVAVKGTLTAYAPHVTFAFTTFDPNSTLADVPENYTTVTYTLEPAGSGVRLSVTQGDFATVADGARRFAEVNAEGGWQGLLEKIRDLAEKL